MRLATDIRDAHRLQHFWSRKEFRQLPLEFALFPSLDAPVLVHDTPPMFIDVTGKLKPCLALQMRDEMREDFRGLRHPADDMPPARKKDLLFKRSIFFWQLRRLWVQIVDQADGYTWPDASHYGAQVMYEFAPDV